MFVPLVIPRRWRHYFPFDTAKLRRKLDCRNIFMLDLCFLGSFIDVNQTFVCAHNLFVIQYEVKLPFFKVCFRYLYAYWVAKLVLMVVSTATK